MEQVLYAILSGAGSGGAIVFLFVQLQSGKIKEELRKEFYHGLDAVAKDANKYTDAKHSDIKESINEIKNILQRVQDFLMTLNINKP